MFLSLAYFSDLFPFTFSFNTINEIFFHYIILVFFILICLVIVMNDRVKGITCKSFKFFKETGVYNDV